jgi:hypothetical protein
MPADSKFIKGYYLKQSAVSISEKLFHTQTNALKKCGIYIDVLNSQNNVFTENKISKLKRVSECCTIKDPLKLCSFKFNTRMTPSLYRQALTMSLLNIT